MISRAMEDGIEYVKMEATEYRSLLERLKMAEEWQPIETAPGDREVMVGFFDHDCDWIHYLAVWDANGFIDSGTGENLERLDYKITHWRELPAPPEGTP
jgi:hypothetical protein